MPHASGIEVDIRPLEGGIGAEVTGLDLDRPIAEPVRERLYRAWLDSGILLFRGIGTSSERQLALSRCFGELEIHPVESIRLEGCPEIITLTSKGGVEPAVFYFDGQPIAGRIPWHTDLIYTTTPCRGGLLRMVEKPARGGQTGWIDTAAAYDALPAALKARIENLEARFDFVHDLCTMRFGRPLSIEPCTLGNIEYPQFPDVAHPLVWTHPESGRRSVCVSPVQLIDMVDMDATAGDALLEELVGHVTDGRFTYVHDWEEGDMVLWDNWRTMHMAFGTPPGLDRVVHRTTIRGDRATGRLLAPA